MQDAPILAKDMLEISDVLTPKVHGTNVLMRLFADKMPEWIALFSSVSTVTAPAGQVDYVAANEYLNACAQKLDNERTRVRVINWGPWAEVGMAFNALEGVSETSLAIGQEVHQPLIASAFAGGGGSATFHARWSTADQWVLDEHRTSHGDALLPGTGYLELFAEALAAKGETRPFEIADLTFISPLRAPDDTAIAVRVTLDSAPDGYRVRVESSEGEEGYELNAEASLRLLKASEAPRIDVAKIARRCGPAETAPELSVLPTPQAQHLQLGPRWQVMRKRRFGENEGMAELRLTTRDEGYRLHPGVMDIATGFGLPLVDGYEPEQFWVPLSYGRVRVHGPIQGETVSWIRSAPENSAAGKTARFDITVAAPDGRVLVEIEGFTMHRMSAGQVFAGASAGTRRGAGRDLSPGEARLRRFVEQGIPPEDGAEMFFRAMASDQRQLVVSSLDLNTMIAEVERTAEALPGTGGEFERPDLDSDFVEPANDLERRLAGFWSELLGVANVGVEDDFFDLGGHSLIAVRLFAKIKSEFSIDLPISVLFEAPTIRKCAELIASQTDTQTSLEGPAETVEKPDQRRFRHVVAMQERHGASGTPFFMVAGMFGNVLNLRHLAHLIGTERPFYGLQAQGLYDEDQHHQSLGDAARDYIAEIRQVQPEGPYMIGGFSGGGITAYEMARQLKAAGEKVAALVLLDTPLPRRRPLSRQDRLKLQFLKLREQGAAYPFDWARQRIRWEFEKRRAVEIEAGETEFHNAAIQAGFLRAISVYEVEPWAGPMTLMRPPLSRRYEVAPGRFVNERRQYADHANDWDQYVPNLQVIEVPGDHDSMVLEPNVRVLASRMRALLEAADKERGSADFEDLHAAE
jgi:thioesterase domain-containing protein/acyl carrier protein